MGSIPDSGMDPADPKGSSKETPRVVAGEGTPKPWGGRFSAEQAPLFERLNASITFDHVLAPYDVAGS